MVVHVIVVVVSMLHGVSDTKTTTDSLGPWGTAVTGSFRSFQRHIPRQP